MIVYAAQTYLLHDLMTNAVRLCALLCGSQDSAMVDVHSSYSRVMRCIIDNGN